MNIYRKEYLVQVMKELVVMFIGGIFCTGFILLNILSISIYIFRVIVIFLAKLHSDYGSILDPLSSILANDLFSKRPPRSNLIVPVTVRGHLTIEEIQKLIFKNWIHAVDSQTGKLLYPQFTQFPSKWLGFLFWENDNSFSIRNHIFCHSNLGNGIVTDDGLNKFTEDLLNEGWKDGRSLWGIHIIHNYYNAEFGKKLMSNLIFKFHHSLLDGFSILDIIVEGILEKSMKDIRLPTSRQSRKSFWQQLVYLITIPLYGFRECSRTFSNVFVKCPWKCPDEEKTWRQLYGKSGHIPVQKIKDIKNAFGVSFTSVLLSAISTGIQNNLEEKRQNGLQFKDANYMHCLSVLPLPPHGSKKLANHLTAAIFDIPIMKFSHPVLRLRKCNEKLACTKDSVIPLGARVFITSLGWQIETIRNFLVKNRMISTGLTNFPAVPQSVFIGDKEVLAVDFACGAHAGLAGVGFMVLSYNENIRMVVTAENAVLSSQELQELVRCMVKEIDTLHSCIPQSTASRDLKTEKT